MTGRGRPLRFVALVTVGWIAMRIAMLWPQTGTLPGAIRAAVPLLAGNESPPGPAPHASMPERGTSRPPSQPGARPPPLPAGHVSASFGPLPGPARVEMALLGLIQSGPAEMAGSQGPPPQPAPLPAEARPGRLDPLPDRWSASGWLLLRPGQGLGAAAGGGQLGGSQAGGRIAWMLAPRARVALFGRVTTPLTGKGREAALGIEWQPGRAPVRLFAEHRFGLDGTPGGPGAGIVAGIDRQVSGFRLEAYGQAGVIARGRAEPYADGAARFIRDIAQGRGYRIAIGAGSWGGAQRGARRLDIGPSAVISAGRIRLSFDWRQRIAGDARPGSGPTLTLGGDF